MWFLRKRVGFTVKTGSAYTRFIYDGEGVVCHTEGITPIMPSVVLTCLPVSKYATSLSGGHDSKWFCLFLQELIAQGLSFSTLKVYLADGVLSSTFEPTVNISAPSWDILLVLDSESLETMESTDIRLLSYATALLLTLGPS